MYSCSSLTGLVSSNRRLQWPSNSRAMPKFKHIDFAWPMCRYPLGSGGKRVTMCECLPPRRSAGTISRMKSNRSGWLGVTMFTKTRINLHDLNSCPFGSAIGEGSPRVYPTAFSALDAAFRKGRPQGDGVYRSVTALETRAVNEERACTESAGAARRSPSQQAKA